MAKDLEAPLLDKKPTGPPFQVTFAAPSSVKLNPLVWILWLLDFFVWSVISTWILVVVCVAPPLRLLPLNRNVPLYFLAFGLLALLWRVARRQFWLRTDATMVEGAFRNARSKELVTSPDPATCKTVWDVVEQSFRTFGSKNMFGTRKFLGPHQPEGARFPLSKFGETQWRTYGEVEPRVRAFGAGLRSLGLEPVGNKSLATLQSQDGPHTILIFEDTCEAWMTAMLGAFSQSVAVATSYSTLGLNSVAESIRETGARAIVCNIKDVAKVAKACDRSRCPSLQHIIYSTNYSLETSPKGEFGHLQVHSMEDVIALGQQKPVAASPPSADSLAVIMYTSGSTGKPKGVMITHGNLVASIGALHFKFTEFGLQKGEEAYVAYLPAAHILELVAELSLLSLGGSVGFADPRTISSKGAVRERPDGTLNTKPEYPYPPGAIQEFRPTVFAAVPKIWDILKKGVEENVGRGSSLKKLLFQAAFSWRHNAICNGFEAPLFKSLIFGKVAGMMGGRLKVGLTGGGPISADVQNFIRTAFAVPLIQGYALTESTCAGTIQMLDDVRNGVIGPPLPSVEIKLRSCLNDKGEPEILDRQNKPYLETDRMHAGKPCLGRGEVMIRGGSVSKGYFKQPEKTAEVFSADGWFRTGDVGLFLPGGTLMIVDRVKNLVKLKGGEYIAIEAMEKEYGTSVYVNAVNGGILCYGDGDMDRPIAFVQVNLHELEKWAAGASIEYSSPEALCSMPQAEKMVLDNLAKIGKDGGLGANEILCAVGLIPGTGSPTGDLDVTSPWTPENGGLTASNKLNRQPIMKAYENTITKRLKEKAIR